MTDDELGEAVAKHLVETEPELLTMARELASRRKCTTCGKNARIMAEPLIVDGKPYCHRHAAEARDKQQFGRAPQDVTE